MRLCNLATTHRFTEVLHVFDSCWKTVTQEGGTLYPCLECYSLVLDFLPDIYEQVSITYKLSWAFFAVCHWWFSHWVTLSRFCLTSASKFNIEPNGGIFDVSPENDRASLNVKTPILIIVHQARGSFQPDTLTQFPSALGNQGNLVMSNFSLQHSYLHTVDCCFHLFWFIPTTSGSLCTALGVGISRWAVRLSSEATMNIPALCKSWTSENSLT